MNHNNNRRRGGRNRNNNNNNRRGRERGGGPSPTIPPLGQPGRNCHRDAITPGIKVHVVQKEDQRSGRETMGIVSRLLTNSKYHPRGIKVMLDDGVVGRVTRFQFDDHDNNNNNNNNDNNHNHNDNHNNHNGNTSNTNGTQNDCEHHEDATHTAPSNTATLADFLPSNINDEINASINADINININTNTNINADNQHPSSDVDVDALATLVNMDFDDEKSREALRMFDNDVQRAVNYLLSSI
jgi:uncharacterized repeat protein (TIGR03833 family)